MRNLMMTILFFAFGTTAFAQSTKPFTVSGTVKDASTGETLIGASVQLTSTKTVSTLSNSYGFFSLNAAEGNYTMVASSGGFELNTVAITISKDTMITILMKPKKNQLDAVVVTSVKKKDNIAKSIMGVDKINMAEMNKMPVLLGERDILKTIQLMPGYKPAGEGSSGINVRGGGTDQNLILLDEAPVYNASHLLGFFSTFNSDAIKDVSAYKGGMPAQFGGRLSSVFDIKMKDGNQKKLDLEGGIGLIASRLKVSAPIVKDKGSFIISARRTYADAFLGLIKDTTNQGKRTVYFYDINAKANYTISKKDRVYLSGYLGLDKLGVGAAFNTDWGNRTATLRWNHIFGKSLFSNTSIILSNFNYNIKIKAGKETFKAASKLVDVNFKQDFDWNISNKSKLRFGGNIIDHTINPPAIKSASSTAGVAKPIQNRYSYESALYASHEWKVNDNFEIVYGVRASNLKVVGAGKFYTYDKDGKILTTKTYGDGEKVISYFNLEPRFSTSYKINNNTTVKASYNRNVQNLHLITNATSSSPTDIWLPSSNVIKPEIADQVAIGVYTNSSNRKYEFTAEAYYKALQNQIDYKNAAVTLGNDNVESELLFGTGRAYGLETMLRKKTGKLTGWVAYTISKSEKKIAGINDGKYFNARQDRTHDISVVGMYDLTKRWSLSGTWVYTTGNAVTFPTGKYEVAGSTVFLYSARNAERFPAYHRLDVAATYEARKNANRRYQSSWTFGLYNAYGRQNTYSINFRENKDNPNVSEAVRTSLFSVVPSVTWNFKF
jgi:CarboxypepD_reg-like domain/TonB-dependent Receptor Plug Domain